MRSLIVTLLSHDYDVSNAADGLAGLEAAQKLRPDLVVLDLLMPRMHGFEVCQKIRADNNLRATKVLISSSKSYQHDVRTAVEETGAHAYIIKPFNIADFTKLVAKLLAEPP